MDNTVEKILFIGLGGAGQRHLRIYRDLLPNIDFYGFRKTKRTPTLNPDFTVDNTNSLKSKYNINFIANIEEIRDIKPDLTIISVPNAYHYLYSEIAFNADSNVFIEKPACIRSSDVKKLIKLQSQSGLKYRVGYQRKYHPIFNLLKRYINLKTFGEVENISINVSSFIPDWHPYENYVDLYACQSSLGGGILNTECHEINMIIDLFGSPVGSNFSFSTRSKEIKNVHDSVTGKIYYKNFEVNLDISFFRKPTKREVVLEFQNFNLLWDIEAQLLRIKAIDNYEKVINFVLKNDELFISQAIDVLKFDISDTLKDLKHLEVFTSILDN
tara:strand:+ start:37446 stop:38429 length:984 start_codon:yes stop_codon:yes gene_type:complete